MTTPNDFRSRAERDAADEVEIRERIARAVEALRAKDLGALERLYTTDVVSFDIEPPLQHVGIAAKLENWATVFQVFESVTYEVRDLTFTVGDDVAFGHAFARLSGTLKNGAATNGCGSGSRTASARSTASG
ncbi:nuclear transport factor 2 family protein [Nocardia sp. NBC_01377]|uniref:YybH family protein n=1 Tax=Nocardia sp. NBC_01377 TaxID=2903595 RepID=UPI003256261E